MDKRFITHWVIGIICVLVWFWGDKVGIPSSAITLSASIVPGLLGHALASPLSPSLPDSAPPGGVSSSGATTS